jgi:hypothetical protein
MEVPVVNIDSVLALFPVVITLLLIYAIFSIAIVVRSIRRSLERREAHDDSGV